MNDARWYQATGIEQIREAFLQGYRKVLFVLPTGGGKTFVFCRMVKDAFSKGNESGIVVRGRKLVDQASKRLFREGVPHGVLMANHWNYKPQYGVQACSVDTILARNIPLDRFKLLVVDEAHLFTPKSDAGELIRNYKGFVVAVTATPYVNGGLRHLADTMIRPVSMQQLIDEGHLVGFRIFAPSEPDTSNVKISSSTKDYNSEELFKVTIAGELTGKIIDHWKQLGENRPTIFFGVNVKHSKMIAEKFNEAGIAAEHCDADTPEREREEILKRSESGKTKIICNVGILCTGVDMPWISCIILGRKTTSFNLYIQQCGRGTRTFDGKFDCLLLDHAGNVRHHGFPTFEPEVDLDGNIKITDSHKMESKICKECFAVYRGPHCPSCGRIEILESKSQIIENDGKLIEIKITATSPIEQWIEYLEQQRAKFGREPKWVYWKLLEKFKYEEAERLLPEWFKEKYNKKKLFDENPFSKSRLRGYRK